MGLINRKEVTEMDNLAQGEASGFTHFPRCLPPKVSKDGWPGTRMSQSSIEEVLIMTETLRIVTMDKCEDCGGEGAYTRKAHDDKSIVEVKCRYCNGEGVTEQQIGIREFRQMLEADAKAEQAEIDAGRFEEPEPHRGDWHADPIEETEVRDAEQS
jgi:hypothetical protein